MNYSGLTILVLFMFITTAYSEPAARISATDPAPLTLNVNEGQILNGLNFTPPTPSAPEAVTPATTEDKSLYLYIIGGSLLLLIIISSIESAYRLKE